MGIDDETEPWFASTLAGAQRGDSAAFDELVRWLERPLLGFVRARGVRDADDIASEALMRVFRRIEGFSGNTAQFRAWVFQITRNLIVDEYRRARRSGHVELTSSGELPHERDAITSATDLEQGERIEALLSGLSAQQREVLLLRVVAGLSVDETAAAIGKRPGAVRALQHRALSALREELARKP